MTYTPFNVTLCPRGCCGCVLYGSFGCVPPLDTFLWLQGGGRPPGFNSLWRGWVYRPMPEAPLFKRGMPTGPDAFLELPVVLSFGSATGPALKIALCHILTLVGRRINTARMQFWKIWSVFEFCHKTIEVYHRIRRLGTKDREFYVPTSKWLRLFSNKA